jgi:hypothetical protein
VVTEPAAPGALVFVDEDLVGAYLVHRTGKQGREQAERLSTEQRRHELAVARDARRTMAYTELVEHVESVGYWAQTVRPAIDFGQHRGDLPPIDRQIKAVGLMMAFASPAVRTAADAWTEAVNAVSRADKKIALGEQTRAEHGAGASGIDILEEWRRLEDDLRPAEKSARDALEAAINSEMNSEA